MTIPPTVPPKWSEDKLTNFLDDWRSNHYATFANKPEIKRLIAIDGCFFKVLDKSVNPKPWFPFHFIHASHSAFRAACGLVMAGQLQEVNALLRLSLENAAYGFYVSTDQQLAELWVKREDSKDTRKEFKKKFQHVVIREAISKHAPKLAKIFEDLYERTIDNGAHPNIGGFSLNTELEKIPGALNFLKIYLHGDGLPLDFAIKCCAQVGICCLSIFQIVYPAKFLLLGVKSNLEELRKGL